MVDKAAPESGCHSRKAGNSRCLVNALLWLSAQVPPIAQKSQIEVTKLLPQVKVSTLVLHCRDDAVQSFEEGRILAAGIPGARFVGLEGQNHLILETDSG